MGYGFGLMFLILPDFVLSTLEPKTTLICHFHFTSHLYIKRSGVFPWQDIPTALVPDPY
jgi:hypothetical protein